LFSADPLNIRVRINTNVFIPGEKVYGLIQLGMPPQYNITSISLRIIRQTLYFASGQRTESTLILGKMLYSKNLDKELRFEFPVPANAKLKPDYSGILISSSHFFEIQIKIPWSTGYSVRIPIKIAGQHPMLDFLQKKEQVSNKPQSESLFKVFTNTFIKSAEQKKEQDNLKSDPTQQQNKEQEKLKSDSIHHQLNKEQVSTKSEPIPQQLYKEEEKPKRDPIQIQQNQEQLKNDSIHHQLTKEQVSTKSEPIQKQQQEKEPVQPQRGKEESNVAQSANLNYTSNLPQDTVQKLRPLVPEQANAEANITPKEQVIVKTEIQSKDMESKIKDSPKKGTETEPIDKTLPLAAESKIEDELRQMLAKPKQQDDAISRFVGKVTQKPKLRKKK